MSTFDRANVEGLNRCFSEHWDTIHDAEIRTLQHDRANTRLTLELEAPSSRKAIRLVFEDVQEVCFFRGDWLGSHDTVESLGVEEGGSFFRRGGEGQITPPGARDELHLAFTTFSGDAWHIFCTRVTIEEA